jgi:hypothetical protein
MSSANSLASQQQLKSENKLGMLNKTREQLSCLNLGNNNSSTFITGGGALTEVNAATTTTSSLEIPHQQRQQITDKNYRVRDTRRNSVLIDKPNKRRLSQQKDNNLLLSPGGSNQLQPSGSPQQTQTQRQRQRTQESNLDYINSVDCT